jgi:hypothetical protein
MLNEGLIVNDTTALVKSEIVKQVRNLQRTTPAELQRAVFTTLVGHGPEEVDWDVEDNQAGYHAWIKSFDRLIHELIEDGYIVTEDPDILVATEAERTSAYSHLVYPPDPSG